ncbi:MAG: O-antigen ligase family protein [Thermoanaerobaculales bacterium]|jgi:O-antigen ligase|nr:O-antigen ligase family protein [Thermoanaerobaculales bacterium]
MVSRHRTALAAILLGNAVVFAGVDPPMRLATAAVVLLMVLDLRRAPEIPRLHQVAVAVVAGLAAVQLLPLPVAIRAALQPGFSEVMATGWRPLSLAPWATVQTVASGVVALGIALTAARAASTRSGLPALLALIAATGVVVAVLGLAGEAGAPEKVLLIRDNTGGGGPYGPFVNENHFAQAVELTLPAGLVLLAVNLRRLRRPGDRRQLAAVTVIAAAVAVAVTAAAMLRSGSRGGALFLVAALVVTLPLWLRPRRFRGAKWPGVAVAIVLIAVVAGLSWARLPVLEEGFRDLIAVEGVDGNTRWDLWVSTIDSWRRSPLVGSGLGSYRHVIGMDKPATGDSVLEQAHNDWLEWLSTAGLVGAAAAALFVAGVVARLSPRRVRRLRFELRYALAGIALALVATGLHEIIGFGLQTPLNRYLLATWIGVLWGLGDRAGGRDDARPTPEPEEGEGEEA